MAENDSNEGKNIAIEEVKKKFEEEVIRASQKMKKGEIKQVNGIEVICMDPNKTYVLGIKGEKIALINNKEFKYNRPNIDELKKKLILENKTTLENYEQENGLPDLEAIAIDQEEKAKKEEEKNSKNPEKDTGAREEEKNEKEIKDNNEGKKPEDEQQEGETKQNYNDNKGIPIYEHAEGGEGGIGPQPIAKIIKDKHPEIKEISKMSVRRSKNNGNIFELVVYDKNGKETQVPLQMVEGENPMHENVTIASNDGKKVEQKKPIQILKMRGSEQYFMIFGGGRYNTEVHIGTRDYNDNYTSTKISGVGYKQEHKGIDANTRESISDTRGNKQENRAENYDKVLNLEKQGVPDDIDLSKDGIETMEIDADTILEKLQKSIEEDFNKHDIPVSHDGSKKIAEALLYGQNFEEAVRAGAEVEEKRGTIIEGSGEAWTKSTCTKLTKEGNEQSQEEQEVDEEHIHRY